MDTSKECILYVTVVLLYSISFWILLTWSISSELHGYQEQADAVTSSCGMRPSTFFSVSSRVKIAYKHNLNAVV